MVTLKTACVRPIFALMALLLTAPVAMSQDTVVEGFDGGSNQGNWAWGTTNQSISPLNGNPGAYLQDLTLFTAQPILGTHTDAPSVFTGDFRERRVTSMGVDLITLNKSFAVESNRRLTLVLLDDNGTPADPNDDRGAYFVGEKVVPDAGVPLDTPAGWATFDFAVDVQSSTMPNGWQPISFGAPFISWADLMSDVDIVEYWSGPPGTIYLFDSWDVGADNFRITTETCQLDLGFGGPGNMQMAVCGDTLATGGTADLTIEGAPASSPIFLFIGVTSTPTPFFSGTLVPIPWLIIVTVPSDVNGSFTSALLGGGGPATVIIQGVVPDASLPGGVGMSNALQIEILP
jgi:hypothetical protein